MKFNKYNEHGITTYLSDVCSDFKITEIDGNFKILAKKSGNWKYLDSEFQNLQDCEKFITNESSKLSNQDINMIKKMYGFDKTYNNDETEILLYTDRKSKDGNMYQIRLMIYSDRTFSLELYCNYEPIVFDSEELTKDNLIYEIDKFLQECGVDTFEYVLCGREHRSSILCASSRDLSKNIVRVKSSNVWGYYLDIKHRKDKTGDLIVQFKNKNGGPGDVYLYFDVPVLLYRKWHSATSVGHFFWQYIRNEFNYRKLTGDKRGKLKNAVN